MSLGYSSIPTGTDLSSLAGFSTGPAYQPEPGLEEIAKKESEEPAKSEEQTEKQRQNWLLFDGFIHGREEGRVLYRRLHGYAKKLTGNPDDADDIMQEVQFQAHLKQELYDPREYPIKLLYRMTKNKVIDRGRRKKNRENREISIETYRNPAEPSGETQRYNPAGREPGPLETAERDENAELLRDCVACLSDNLRQVVELVYFHGLKYQEAADILGMPIGTVKSNLGYAKRKLEGLLRKRGYRDAA